MGEDIRVLGTTALSATLGARPIRGPSALCYLVFNERFTRFQGNAR